ncbi:MAG TPA: hypothetical protein VIL63_10350 [Terriglobales bacterium]|jgi:hypothetical protein
MREGDRRTMNWTSRDKAMLCEVGALALAIVLILAVYARWGLP